MRQLKQQSLRRRCSNIVSTKQNSADPWIMTTKEHEFWWICGTNVDPCFLAWTPEKLITKNIWQKRRGKGGKTLTPNTVHCHNIFQGMTNITLFLQSHQSSFVSVFMKSTSMKLQRKLHNHASKVTVCWWNSWIVSQPDQDLLEP